ncbi:MAG: hypothetical protein RMM06_06960 [Armatimonadota bacterium]|nr:hypothetical protein [bacterium]MDW8290447.1 hypothetical protein [Armatimonadota bacterium]
MPQNGQRGKASALDMPIWMMILVIVVMLLIAGFAFWYSAKMSYDALPRSQATGQQ